MTRAIVGDCFTSCASFIFIVSLQIVLFPKIQMVETNIVWFFLLELQNEIFSKLNFITVLFNYCLVFLHHVSRNYFLYLFYPIVSLILHDNKSIIKFITVVLFLHHLILKYVSLIYYNPRSFAAKVLAYLISHNERIVPKRSLIHVKELHMTNTSIVPLK